MRARGSAARSAPLACATWSSRRCRRESPSRDERGRVLQRHHLLAQAPVAPREFLPQVRDRVDASGPSCFAPCQPDGANVAPDPDLRVEFFDHPVPYRQAVDDAVQKTAILATLEILDADALLLDPGVVAEIEDALALGSVSSSTLSLATPSGAEPKISPALTSSKPSADSAVRDSCGARCHTSRRCRWRRS